MSADPDRYLTPVEERAPHATHADLRAVHAKNQRMAMLVGYIPPRVYGQCAAHGRVRLENVRDWPDFGLVIGECSAPGCGTTLSAEGGGTP